MSISGFSQAPPAADAQRTIPFDYRFLFDLSKPGESYVDRQLSQTVTVSIEAAFIAVSIGYGLLAPEGGTFRFGPSETDDLVPIDLPPPALAALPMSFAKSFLLASRAQAGRRASAALSGPVKPGQVLLGDVIGALSRKLDETFTSGRIGPRTGAALINGIRINPELAKKILIDGGEKPLESDDLEELFETVALPPQHIQFLYALYDEGTGRAFQSEPILNIAGLGIDDGDRPFRHFSPPIKFAPRTTIRLDVVPKTKFKGELHIVLHGYKVLGERGTPTGTVRRRKR